MTDLSRGAGAQGSEQQRSSCGRVSAPCVCRRVTMTMSGMAGRRRQQPTGAGAWGDDGTRAECSAVSSVRQRQGERREVGEIGVASNGLWRAQRTAVTLRRGLLELATTLCATPVAGTGATDHSLELRRHRQEQREQSRSLEPEKVKLCMQETAPGARKGQNRRITSGGPSSLAFAARALCCSV